MASEQGLAAISNFFREAYDKPIEPGSYELWLRIFYHVSDNVLIRAAHWLIEKREISRTVVPGEMAKAVEAVGGTVRKYQAEKTFKDDPIVRALDSRSRHEADEGGISLHEWLQQEGCQSFKEAMIKHADYDGGVVPVLQMVGRVATRATLPAQDKTWEEIAKEVDNASE